MTPNELLDLWEQRYFALDSDQRAAFLSRPTVPEIVAYPREAVLEALIADRRLVEILSRLQCRSAPVSQSARTVENVEELDALALLRRIAGPAATFRPDQAEAIAALVDRRSRALVVQRTGWGKSAVYLITTRLLRDRGSGPTVIVSPLLALMRNQIDMAERAGVRAETINSSNTSDWPEIIGRVEAGAIDLLLISPERLANQQFMAEVFPAVTRDLGLLVVDEAHCISDWGHDFRPDYRRLRNIVRALPPRVPVLATTATANDRVVEDVGEELGGDLEVFRGPLDRESLQLQVVHLPDRADRMAWLAQTIPALPGAGIVYCLTIKDANRVGDWLKQQGVAVEVYTGGTDDDMRLAIERRLDDGSLKAVVATSALGMGYDNPHIEFVIHYQTPGSPIAYYQQVGRAGRAVDTALGILMHGSEDDDIVDYFIDTAFPTERDTSAVLEALREPRRLSELEAVANIGRKRLTNLLKNLEVEGAIYKEDGIWHRSAKRWVYPAQRVDAVTNARRSEQASMKAYLQSTTCLMQQLRQELDDPDAAPCGRCANCRGMDLLPAGVSDELRSRVIAFLNRQWLTIAPRKQNSAGLDVSAHPLEEGRCLSIWGDAGWGERVEQGKYRHDHFDDALVDTTVTMIREWQPEPYPTWLTCVPSSNRPQLVPGFARRLAGALGLEFIDAVTRVEHRRPQKTMQNSFHQARNVNGAFTVNEARPGAVFLVDDVVDSRWTFTSIGIELLRAGSGPVYPVALADTSKAGQ